VLAPLHGGGTLVVLGLFAERSGLHCAPNCAWVTKCRGPRHRRRYQSSSLTTPCCRRLSGTMAAANFGPRNVGPSIAGRNDSGSSAFAQWQKVRYEE
jgi:hypothetical protein